MARGNSRAQSELSDSLQRKARDLRRENDDERKEVETNQDEYERARKYAVARAEEEVAEEFRKKKLELDEAEQARREKEAADAEAAAEAELERERTDEQRREIFEAKVKKDFESSAFDYEDWTETKWFNAAEESKDPNIRRLTPSLDNQDERLYLSNEYIQASIDKAPKGIRDVVKQALEGFRADGLNGDTFPGQKAEKLYYGFNRAYNEAAFGKGNDGRIDPTDIRYGNASLKGLTQERHDKGMKNLAKVDEYVAKIIKGSSKHITDKDGNKV